MGSMGTKAGGTLSSAESHATPTTCAAHCLPSSQAWRQWDRLTGGQQHGNNQGALAASASPPARSRFMPHASHPGGCTSAAHGWLLCELVPLRDGEEQRWRELHYRADNERN